MKKRGAPAPLFLYFTCRRFNRMSEKAQPGKGYKIPGKKMSPGRHLLFRFILVLMPFFILGFIELALRVAGVGREIPLFVDDPAQQGYLQINPMIARRYFLDPLAAPAVHYPPFRKEKTDRTFRVVVQGASTAAGIPFKHGGSFPSMLEHRLRASMPGREVEVINTAITAVCSYTLLDLVDDITAIEPDAVIVYAGHNEYYGVLGVGSSQQLGRLSGLVRFYNGLSRLRIVRLMRKVHGAILSRRTAEIISRPNSTLMERMVLEREIPYGSKLYRQGVNQFMGNMTRLAEKYRKNRIPLFLCTLVSNQKDLEPFISDEGSGEQGSARFHYDLGWKFLELGDTAEAGLDFTRASDLDLLRFRAPSEFNAILSDIAKDQGATLVDVQQVFEAASPGGIIGKELMTEHVHPNIQGYFLMADACYNSLYGSGIARGDWVHNILSGTAREELPVTEVDSVYGHIGVTVLKNSWPFMEGVASRHTAKELFIPGGFVDSLALDLFSEEITWGEAMNRLYQHDLSVGEFRKALTVANALQVELKGSGVPYNMAARAYSELGQQGRAVEALRRAFEIEPMPQIAYNLGNSMIKTGDVAGAVPYLEYFLQYQPGRKDVASKLAMIRELHNLEEQINRAPDSTELFIYTAYLYLQMDLPHVSDSLLGEAYRNDPGNALLNRLLIEQ
jgi:lysophospholipase L1-like esterase